MAVSKEKAEKAARELFTELKKKSLLYEEMSMALILQSAYYITGFVEAHDMHRIPENIEAWSQGLRKAVDEILKKRYPVEWERLKRKN